MTYIWCHVIYCSVLVFIAWMVVEQKITQKINEKYGWNFQGINEIASIGFALYHKQLYFVIMVVYGIYGSCIALVLVTDLVSNLGSKIPSIATNMYIWLTKVPKASIAAMEAEYLMGLGSGLTTPGVKVLINSHHMSDLMVIASKTKPTMPLIHIFPSNTAYNYAIWQENLKSLAHYDSVDLAQIEIKERIHWDSNLNLSKIKTVKLKIIHELLCSSYSLIYKNNSQHMIYLQNNGTNPVTEFHIHKHMQVLVNQGKYLGQLSSNTYYTALHDLPNSTGDHGFANGALVAINDQGLVESIECTFQHKCLAYNTHWDNDYKFKLQELENSMRLHLDKYTNVDYVVVSCVNGETFNKLNDLLLINSDLADKIIPVDLSYQYYSYIILNPQQQLVWDGDGQLSIKIQQWNQTFGNMLDPIQNKLTVVGLEDIDMYNKIKDSHNQLYNKHQGQITSNPQIKKTMKILLSQTPDIYVPTVSPDEQVNKLLVHQLLNPSSK